MRMMISIYIYTRSSVDMRMIEPIRRFAFISDRHLLAESPQLPGASRLSFVGLVEPDGLDKDRPVRLDWDYDAMRKAEFDLDTGWNTLVKEVQEDCSLM